MSIKKISELDDPIPSFLSLLEILHVEGPVNSEILEKLSYYKKFYPDMFAGFEERVISSLGLFYKVKEPTEIYSFLISGFGREYEEEFGERFTPVQASVRRAIEENNVTSISAPTSAGKSFSIRSFIAEQKGDAVIVVPSRALIAEYINTMKRKFGGDKNIMISSFVDDVFRSRKLRRIFILTPERARELFSVGPHLNIETFFFDEAQVSEEQERGITFDVLVRRIKKRFSSAKVIFAHPFVDNPDAQIKKHGFDESTSFSRAYTQGTVGRICVYQHDNKGFYYFSPNVRNGHQIKHAVECSEHFRDFAFDGTKSVLVYVSKASIYDGTYLEDYKMYTTTFPEVEDVAAKHIIQSIERILGSNNGEHKSNLVQLLKRGIVIHHGSVPLEVRFLIEDFIKLGFAKICFATSTLAQGVNMPFDIVWLDNMRFIADSDGGKSLALKNLIGRAGRLSDEASFDFGYVYTSNPKLFSKRINDNFVLNENSVIDMPVDDGNNDSKELLDAIKTNTFDDDMQAALTKIERLSSDSILDCCQQILDILYSSESFRSVLHGGGNAANRNNLMLLFKAIFEASINRELFDGERAVFEQAISIFLQVIQGRAFKEIVGIRYSYISRKDSGHSGFAEFSQPAEKLPNAKLKKFYSLLKVSTPASKVSYDTIVFDTYDYIDQVLSFSLIDAFIVAFKVYKNSSNDIRVDDIINLFRFGTNNKTYTLLMRYGFPPESVAEIEPFISLIDEDKIHFKPSIYGASQQILDLVEWYLP